MTHPTQDNQGRNFDVEQDPDGFGITFRFYGWLLVLIGVLALCIGLIGWKFLAGIAWCGAVAALLYWFAFGDIK